MTRLRHCEGVDRTTERATTSSPDLSARRQAKHSNDSANPDQRQVGVLCQDNFGDAGPEQPPATLAPTTLFAVCRNQLRHPRPQRTDHGLKSWQLRHQRAKPVLPGLFDILKHALIEEIIRARKRNVPDRAFLPEQHDEVCQFHPVPIGTEHTPEVIVVAGASTAPAARLEQSYLLEECP